MAIEAVRPLLLNVVERTLYHNLDTTRTIRTYSYDVLVVCDSPDTASRVYELFNHSCYAAADAAA